MKKTFSRIYTGICFAFLYIPILILIVFSFNTSKGATWTGFTTKWYVELFRNQATSARLSIRSSSRWSRRSLRPF